MERVEALRRRKERRVSARQIPAAADDTAVTWRTALTLIALMVLGVAGMVGLFLAGVDIGPS